VSRTKKDLLFSIALFLVSNGFVRGEEDASTPEDKDSSFVVAPAISSSPGFGNGLGAVGLYFFNPDKDDEISPPSTLTAIGMYSDTDSYFTGFFGKVYLQEDTWRLTGGVPHGRVNSRLDIGTAEEARFENAFTVLVLDAQRKISGPWYGGLRFITTDQRYKAKNATGKTYLDAFEAEDTRNSKIAALVSYDSRDNQRYPESGSYGETAFAYAPESWTESEEYYVIGASAASFFPIRDNQVLALQFKGKTVSEEAPYYERPTLGDRGDLRGYTPGEVVGHHQLLLQLEYRMVFTRLLGAAVFGGGSGLWENTFTSDDLYWSYGAGLRIRLQQENKVNFRIDYAIGENDQDGWYISISEAF